MTKQLGALLFLFVGLFLYQPAQAQATPTLLITEVYYDTPGEESAEEWVEIANVGTAVIPLSNIKIGDEEEQGGSEGMVRFPEGATIEPGEVIVIAQTAVGFQALFGFNPDYEFKESDPAVPNMLPYLQWASGEIALANSGDELLLLDEQDAIIDSLSYGNSSYFFNPPIPSILPTMSLERTPAHCDTNTAADWQPQIRPTPGQIPLDGECISLPNPADHENLPPIGQLQGSSNISPYLNQTVTFRGVVTGSYEDRNSAGTIFYTLFVQDLVGYEDGDPATSDGMAIFLGRRRPFYQIGDQLRITGQVTEFFGFTEIDDTNLEIIVEASNRPLPEPIAINPPADNQAQAIYFEAYEGMRVTIPGAAQVVGATFSACSFAVVNEGLGRIVRRNFEGAVGQIVPILHTSDVDCGNFPHVKSGDSVSGITGPLIYNFDQFKIVQQETQALIVNQAPFAPIPPPPTATADQFTIATFNVENYFDMIDDTGDDAEPKPTAEQLATKQSKLAQTISAVLGCPTIIGIQEVEKASLLHDLAALAAPACGFTYSVAHLESADGRGIDVALLADPRRVTVQDVQLKPTCASLNTGISDPTLSCPAGQQPLFSRPPLQVTVAVDGQRFTLFVNHFKSKRGGEQETVAERLAQANHIVSLVAELTAVNRAAQIIVLGDFNDYELSPTMQAMYDGGLFNALSLVPEAERYSFVFSGASQLIDGILVSSALVNRITAVHIPHINADYPDILGADATIPHQATDHDIPLLVLQLNEPTEPIALIPTAADAEADSSSFGGWLGIFGGATAVILAIFLYLRRARR